MSIWNWFNSSNKEDDSADEDDTLEKHPVVDPDGTLHLHVDTNAGDLRVPYSAYTEADKQQWREAAKEMTDDK